MVSATPPRCHRSPQSPGSVRQSQWVLKHLHSTVGGFCHSSFSCPTPTGGLAITVTACGPCAMGNGKKIRGCGHL